MAGPYRVTRISKDGNTLFVEQDDGILLYNSDQVLKIPPKAVDFSVPEAPEMDSEWFHQGVEFVVDRTVSHAQD
jgi:hypothetical protein